MTGNGLYVFSATRCSHRIHGIVCHNIDGFGFRHYSAQTANLIHVIMDLFKKLWISIGYEMLTQVKGDNAWFGQQPAIIRHNYCLYYLVC